MKNVIRTYIYIYIYIYIYKKQKQKTNKQTNKQTNSSINDIAVPVIKRNSDLFSLPLTILFKQSVASETFPTKLKNAKVTPIHKIGPNTINNNKILLDKMYHCHYGIHGPIYSWFQD